MRPNFRVILRRSLFLRCPACGRGRVFSAIFTVAPECVHCWLSYYREPGFFVGAMYLNFVLSVAAVVVLYAASRLFLPASWAAFSGSLVFWFALSITFCLATLRHARSLWLAFIYWMDPWPPTPPALGQPNPYTRARYHSPRSYASTRPERIAPRR